MMAQTQVHTATSAHTILENAHACTRSAALLMATFQLISRSVYPAASANTPPPPPPPAASVTFLHGNIVCYEQCNSNFIVHEVTPAALITFLLFFFFLNDIAISDTSEPSERRQNCSDQLLKL